MRTPSLHEQIYVSITSVRRDDHQNCVPVRRLLPLMFRKAVVFCRRGQQDESGGSYFKSPRYVRCYP